MEVRGGEGAGENMEGASEGEELQPLGPAQGSQQVTGCISVRQHLYFPCVETCIYVWSKSYFWLVIDILIPLGPFKV